MNSNVMLENMVFLFLGMMLVVFIVQGAIKAMRKMARKVVRGVKGLGSKTYSSMDEIAFQKAIEKAAQEQLQRMLHDTTRKMRKRKVWL